MNRFERYLSFWVALCMIVGVFLGKLFPSTIALLRHWEFGTGSQINVPIAMLIWLMIIPMMMKVDFASIRDIGKKPRGLFITLFVNWLVKPFSMALIAWFFFRHLFAAWITPSEAAQYIAGTIILAAAPCTAMVFVWSHLTKGDPAYTLVQVSVNDLLMLFLFAPIVRFLVSGASSLEVPFQVLLYSVIAFIVIPLSFGIALRTWFIRKHGKNWFEKELLPRFSPVSILALLATLICIFAFPVTVSAWKGKIKINVASRGNMLTGEKRGNNSFSNQFFPCFRINHVRRAIPKDSGITMKAITE